MVGTFDGLNPFILKGRLHFRPRPADPVFSNLVFEPSRGATTSRSLYGLIAGDRDAAGPRLGRVHSHPKARFSDGKPVTVDDVVFSLELLRDKGPQLPRLFQGGGIERIGNAGSVSTSSCARS